MASEEGELEGNKLAMVVSEGISDSVVALAVGERLSLIVGSSGLVGSCVGVELGNMLEEGLKIGVDGAPDATADGEMLLTFIGAVLGERFNAAGERLGNSLDDGAEFGNKLDNGAELGNTLDDGVKIGNKLPLGATLGNVLSLGSVVGDRIGGAFGMQVGVHLIMIMITTTGFLCS